MMCVLTSTEALTPPFDCLVDAVVEEKEENEGNDASQHQSSCVVVVKAVGLIQAQISGHNDGL